MNPRNPHARKRIGLLGGSFNPAHAGHLQISEEALKRLNLDEVWWLLTPQNPLKPSGTLLPLLQRKATAQALTCHNRRIRITTLEQQLGTQYSIDTITRLQQRFHRTQFVWLIGADNLQHFHRWRNWQSIFQRIPVAIFDRSPFTYSAMHGKAAQRFRAYRIRDSKNMIHASAPAWCYVHIVRNPASSTALRSIKV